MFGNFIYIIIALLIYTAYQPPEQYAEGLAETVILFASLSGCFFLMTRISFRRIAKQARDAEYDHQLHALDQRFEAALSRQSILAILVFAFGIHGLNLPYFFKDAAVVKLLPTIGDLVFILVFAGLLVLTWFEAYAAYQAIQRTDMRRSTYVRSQVSFSLPILLPWLILSLLFDLILALPFEQPKQFLSTPSGEILFFLIMLVIIAILAPDLIKRIWGCEPLESGFFRTRIEEFCQKAGLEYADILNWPLFGGRMVTAGVMGLIRRFRYILVTPALLDILNPEEIDAVIAHEIGHVKKYHLLFYLFFFTGFMLLIYGGSNVMLYMIILSEPLYRFMDMLISGKTGIPPNLAGLAMMVLLFGVYFRFVFGFFMRNFERQADLYALQLVGTATPLIRTFQKIVLTSGQAAEKPNWHHFSIRERMDYLLKCEADHRWIGRHDRKVRRGMGLYFTAILLIGLPGLYLNLGGNSRLMNSKAFENVIMREIDKNPTDFRFHALLGDLLLERGESVKAAAAYEQSLRLNRENAYVLNNYAWMLATAEDSGLRNPVRALEMARQAVKLDPSSHIWDTLAECLYVNGHFVEAVDAAEKALETAKDNKAYYEEQLVRFQAAAGAI